MGVRKVGLGARVWSGDSIQFYYIGNSPFWGIPVSAHGGCPVGK